MALIQTLLEFNHLCTLSSCSSPALYRFLPSAYHVFYSTCHLFQANAKARWSCFPVAEVSAALWRCVWHTYALYILKTCERGFLDQVGISWASSIAWRKIKYMQRRRIPKNVNYDLKEKWASNISLSVYDVHTEFKRLPSHSKIWVYKSRNLLSRSINRSMRRQTLNVRRTCDVKQCPPSATHQQTRQCFMINGLS